MKLFVKKITSLHPTKYKFEEIDKSLEKYINYTSYFYMVEHSIKKPKTFKDWLKTEI